MGFFSSVEAVLFDLADTLVYHTQAAEKREGCAAEAAARVLAGRGCRVSEYEYRESKSRMWKAWKETYGRREMEFAIEEFLGSLVRELGLEEKYIPGATSLIVRDMYRQELGSIALKRGVGTLLDKLDKAGYYLGIVSNATFSRSHTVNILKKVGIADYFKAVIVSSSEKICKPNPGIFLKALENTGIPPGGAVFVGNEIEADVKGALRAGMKSIYVPDSRECRDAGLFEKAAGKNPGVVMVSDIIQVLDCL